VIIGKFPRFARSRLSRDPTARSSKPHISGLTEMIFPPPQMFSTSGEEFSFTLSRVHRAGKPAEMFRTGGGDKLL
jgi:hypothetical protein